MGKILIADDEAGVRQALVHLLEEEGHEVIEAADGEAALEMVAAHNPDVMLLDNVMPKKDGFQVLEILRKNKASADLPVIMVSVRGAPRDRDAAVRLGVVDYISKPWTPGEIELRVKWALKSAGMVPAVPWDLSDAEGAEPEAIKGKAEKREEAIKEQFLGPALGGNVEIITPETGGSVDTPDGVVRVDVPAGAVPEIMALDAQRAEESEPVIPATLRLKMGKTVADLTFTDRTGAPIEGVRLDKPAKITIKYTEEDLDEHTEIDLTISKLNHETGRWMGLRTVVDLSSRSASAFAIRFSKSPTRVNAKILVIEDSDRDRESLIRTLTNSGYQVLDEKRGDRALERVWEEQPDVVIVDLDLPRMDGFRVLRALKNDPRTRRTSVIMLGNDVSEANYAAAMTLGARDLIAKPWHAGDLQRRVHRAFNASRIRSRQAMRAIALAQARMRPESDDTAPDQKLKTESGSGLAEETGERAGGRHQAA
ncbi:MAG: response regulator [Chloroflexi bacterium]|nr:response regulator [Chloroflexota bacterium]